MDVNAIKRPEALLSAGAPPVVRAPAPKQGRAEAQASAPNVSDIVDLSKEVREQAASAAVQLLNEDNVRSGARIFHDDVTNRFVVEIYNAKNEEIRQIPSEELLRIAARFREVTGVIFDEKA